jgi:putative FmdB family regulatory protein
MPAYDFRCNTCGATLTLVYKTFAAYDAATPACTQCGSTDLTRIITHVNIGKPTQSHNYKDMSANEMLSVLESGDSRAVGEMMKQVGAGASKSQLGEDYHNAADALSRGVDANTVERDLGAGALGESKQDAPSKPPAADAD